MSLTFLLLICLVVVVAAAALLTVYVVYRRLCYFSDRSIPCPPIPSVFLGHLATLWSAASYSEQLHQWTKQYGSVYGLFEGWRPMFVTSDVDFIEQVFIKQFTHFPARQQVLISRWLGEKRANVFSAYTPLVWKRQRKILQPVFGGPKMKRLLPTVETCMDVFMDKLAEASEGAIIDMYEVYKRVTMDVICQCAFSTDTDVQNDVDNTNIYMTKVGELFAHDPERTPLAKLHRITSHSLFSCLPLALFHVQRLLTTKQSNVPPNLWLLDHMHDFIQHRLHRVNTGKSADDLVQLMLDAMHSDKGQLTSGELLSNAFIVFVAGFETTSTALAYCTYRLAIHQDIQHELYEELQQQTSLDHESVAKLTTMDLFIREVFRMHPIATQVVHRRCMEDTHVAGYDIRRGTLVQVDVLSVHYDQELWGPEPVDEFHPQRHCEKRHPLAWMPFGAGPRICVGMHFALMETKLCLARLIKTYRVLPSSSEPWVLKITEPIMRVPEKVCVKLEKRSESVSSP